jgi:hypothetical protein
LPHSRGGFDRLEKSLDETFLCGTRTDNIGSDAVDAGIEIVETDMYAVESVAAYNLLAEVERVVVHDGYVVGVPTYGTAHVKHDFRA